MVKSLLEIEQELTDAATRSQEVAKAAQTIKETKAQPESESVPRSITPLSVANPVTGKVPGGNVT